MAELFEDHSPLQLMAAGQWQGRAFTLVGRLQYKGETGTWTEWNALFDDGTAGVLGEDNGAYVFVVPAAMRREVPQAAQFRVGATTADRGQALQRGLQPAGGAALGAGRAAQAAGARPAVRHGGAAQRRRRGALHRLRLAAAAALARQLRCGWRTCGCRGCAKTARRKSADGTSPARTAARRWRWRWLPARASPAAPATA